MINDGNKGKNQKIAVIQGVPCEIHRVQFPDKKKRDVYTFTVPGFEQCSITGIRETKRVIKGRLSPYARWACGIKD